MGGRVKALTFLSTCHCFFQRGTKTTDRRELINTDKKQITTLIISTEDIQGPQFFNYTLVNESLLHDLHSSECFVPRILGSLTANSKLLTLQNGRCAQQRN